MNVSELLSRNARKYPHQEAVIINKERISYKQLNEYSNRLASSLRELKIAAGDKVVLILPNCLEFVISYFAVQRLGAIVVPVHAKLSVIELEYIISNCNASAVIIHDSVKESAAFAGHPTLISIKTGKQEEGWRSFDCLLKQGDTSEIACTLSEDDEAAILYTSGTTGKPKGVLFTNRNILAAAIMMCVEMSYKPESRILHMMPLSHSAPLHLFLVAGTYAGAAHVLSEVFTPELLLNLVQKERITHFFGAPVAYLLTAKQPGLAEYNLASMKCWVYGGAPLPEKDVRFIQDKLQTKDLYCVYGLTESGPTGMLLLPEDHDKKAGSIGKRGALGTEFRIADHSGYDVSVGEAGEILLYSEGNMKGYYGDPAETNHAYFGKWIRTGDIGRMDRDGYVWIIDRKKDVIISGGVNVYPKEIEEELLKHPSVIEAAVIGVPHPEWGETVKAVMVMSEKPENLQEEFQEFLYGKLAAFKLPRLYETCEALPRNATGKVLKQVLRKKQLEV
ncbi:AMP-binding protein [Bacillus sp. MUM 13]|uniref:class I adenylate-forming enzyme family protein n=1 Tax=Bacillus sp. MUM 13 TaxID=1678001 RepID=UPI0008F586BE|nr:AMP-binding protein [Bacillus sp. MUM 13]OIK11607.1 o-succinylbenzoate--CoA ligase [Bacillus sp. MUM 13]